VAEDRGYEEHGGGHASCYDCLREHGRCVETCYARQFECVATGRDRWGNLNSVRLAYPDRRYTETEVLRVCSQTMYNCRVDTCNDVSQVESRRDCN
jgi:hypothetical protein